MALVDGVKYGLSSHSFSSEKKTVIFVKLTDSALRAIEDCLQLQHKTGQHATLQFLGNEGRIHIPSSHSIDGHSFDFSLQSNADIEGPQGSFECIQQCGSRSLESMGPLPFKMRIHAKDDVYDLTRKRINFVEDKRKKDCAKEIKSNNADIGRKVKKRIGAGGLQLPLPQRREPSPISGSSYPNPKSTSNSSSSSSLLGSGSHSNNNSNNKYFNGFGSSANGGGGGYGGYGGNNSGGNHGSNNSNYKHGGPLHPHSNGPSSKMGHGNNMDITRRPLRERLIHMLALKPLKKPELMSKIYKDGIKEKEKKMLMMILQSVSQLKDNVYNLSRGIWNDVHEDWPFYTEEERQIMKRRKPQNLTPPGSDCSVGSGTSGSSSSPRSTTSGSGHSPSSYSSSTLSMNNYTSTHHLSNSNYTSSPALSSASNNAALQNNMTTKASSQNYSSHSQNSSIPTSQPQGVKRSNPNLSSCDSNNNSSGGGLLSSQGGVAGDLVGGLLPAVGSDNIPTKKQRISNFKRPNCSNSSNNIVNSNNSSSSSSNSSSSANNANNALLDIRDNSRDSPLHQPPHKETPPHHPHPHHRNGIISQNGNNAEDRVMSPSLSNGASGIIAKSNVISGLGPHASVNVIANVVNANVVNNQKKDHHTSPPYNINNQSSNHNHNNRRDKLLVKSEQQDNGHGSSGGGMDIDLIDPDMDGHDHDNDDDFIPMDIGGGSGVVAGTAATVSLINPPSVVLSNVNVKSTSSPSSVSINPPSSAHHTADPAFGTVVTLINNNSSNNILRDESSNYIKDNLNSASNNNNSGLIVKREIRERDQQYNSNNSNSNSNLNSGGNMSEHNGSVVNLLSGCNRVTSTTSSGGSNFHTPQSSHSSPDSQISGFIASSTNHNQTSLSVNNNINNNSNSLSIESLGPGGGSGPGRGRSRDRVNVKDPRGGVERERDRTSSSTRLNGRVSDRDSRDRDRVGNGCASGNSVGGGGGERENDRPRGRERERGESNRDRDRHRDSEWPVKIETETPPSFNTEYTTIRTLEQRNRYKADFNAAYAEYLDLHSVIDKVSKKFAQLEERLRKEDKGSEGYQVVRDQIIKEYNFNKNSSKYVDARARYAYMHEKLSYIKRLVLEFDSLHSTDTSSIASASSAPTSVALPPPSSSAITNNSSTLPTSPDDEYF